MVSAPKNERFVFMVEYGESLRVYQNCHYEESDRIRRDYPALIFMHHFGRGIPLSAGHFLDDRRLALLRYGSVGIQILTFNKFITNGRKYRKLFQSGYQ
jgi:hypothetical protein